MESKVCTKCETEKPLGEFHKFARSPDGHKPVCKPCNCAARKVYYEENKEQHAETCRAWVEANQDKVRGYKKAYVKANRKKVNARNGRFQKNNRAKYNAYEAKRRARKANTTPVQNDSRVKAIYYIAQALCELGPEFHVDHIVPLCKGGAHDYKNLQVLPAKLNLIKGSK